MVKTRHLLFEQALEFQGVLAHGEVIEEEVALFLVSPLFGEPFELLVRVGVTVAGPAMKTKVPKSAI